MTTNAQLTDEFKLLTRRASELKAERARRLGRLVLILRGKRNLTREAVANRLAEENALQWLTNLEQELLHFEDVTLKQVMALAAALQVSAIWLVESCGFALWELNNPKTT